MRVGFYSDTLLPRLDGIAVSIEAAGSALRELGVRLEVVAPYDPLRTTSSLPIRPVPALDLWFRDYRLGAVWPPAGSRSTAASRYDVVHVHTLGTVGIAGLYAAWRQGVPTVLTWHTDIVAYQRHYREIRLAMSVARRMWRFGIGAPKDYRSSDRSAVVSMVRGVDLIVAPTPKVQHHLDELGCDPRTVVLPSPTIPLPTPSIGAAAIRRTLRIGPHDPVVLSVGRLSGEKNDELLLRGFAQLLTSHPTACLVLVGQRRERRRVSRLIDQLGISANVRLTGVVPREELAGYYATASVVVICSLTETQSLVAQEAEGVGCPLVVVDPWLARGTSRVLAAPDPAGLASAIGRCLPLRASAQPVAAYRPDPRDHARRLLTIYEDLIRAGSPANDRGGTLG